MSSELDQAVTEAKAAASVGNWDKARETLGRSPEFRGPQGRSSTPEPRPVTHSRATPPPWQGGGQPTPPPPSSSGEAVAAGWPDAA